MLVILENTNFICKQLIYEHITHLLQQQYNSKMVIF